MHKSAHTQKKHLQEIPDHSSNVATSFTWGWGSSKTYEWLSGMGNIPQELLLNLSHPQSPPRKRLKSKVNDRDFVIVHRPKLNQENFPGVSWDSLPDELLLGIFSCLYLPELLNISSVCKRWCHLAFDEFLWQTVDLVGRSLYPDVVGRLLSRGVVAVCYLDLSNSVITVSTLHGLLSHCSNNLAQNTNLLRLNLSGYSGFSESSLKTLPNSCSRMDELNLSWCYDFTEKHVQVAVTHMSETITQLNLSRYRKNLQRSDVCTLVGRCPNLVHLDLSNSVMLKNDCFPEFYQLNYLQHLSFSWCYDIIPETLLELGEIPTLKTLQVFGIMPDGTLQLLKEALPHLQINCSHFTTITRPTIGNKKNQEIWGIKC
ncbi:hypothetical protein FD754_007234 [Muntiacus muntjak]|uniref:F-box domain-containing protein n=1 Tax=Muntiacus muntjak TaxID=9888 RepID=A0A5N3WQJ1_MUNMU|nr:hypothetical protein FD754_007234 [Muntiacus muntjak]